MDELYEAFCIQSRLREGAIRMKQAFSSSPSTKATKESIAEVNRRHKEYTEVPSPRPPLRPRGPPTADDLTAVFFVPVRRI